MLSCFDSRKAVDAIMREARLGAARADVSGPSGWKKCAVMKTNKRFLTNTLVQHINSNRIIEKKKTNKAKSYRPERGRSSSSDPGDRRSRKHSKKAERSRKDSASKSEKFRDSKVSKEKKKKRKHSKDDDGKRKKHKSKHRER
jgi:hypothetical protein